MNITRIDVNDMRTRNIFYPAPDNMTSEWQTYKNDTSTYATLTSTQYIFNFNTVEQESTNVKWANRRQHSVMFLVLIEAKTAQSWLAVLIKNNKQVAKYCSQETLANELIGFYRDSRHAELWCYTESLLNIPFIFLLFHFANVFILSSNSAAFTPAVL